ncbi:RNA polymerase factor sigma-54 [Halobacillus campisalis]|uniref:RNA polymerase factor sigma-54 n=1 Tax=Halobacillus campisalis TaxID=435909 RepID=A0ABW2K0Z4_9BACI|nr:RNA polymerase factor sigma-54 [Halobacillus campisalis]
MKLELTQNQSTRLKMTKELRQAISLLQYTQVELVDFIKEQAMENPLIEIVEPSPTNFSSPNLTVEDYAERLVDWRQTLLEEQRLLTLSEMDKKVVSQLILNLHDNGFLPYTKAELATEIDVEEKDVESGLSILKQLQPGGLGCYGFREYLLFQVKNHADFSLIRLVIENHLPELADENWAYLAEHLSITRQKVMTIANLIKSLSPRPMLPSTKQAEYIAPDFYVEKVGERYEVSLNKYGEPRIYMNSHYKNIEGTAGEYVKTCYNKASWLIRSIEKRHTTMLKVAQSIVDRQIDFLNDEGKGAFAPLQLKDIAEEIDRHESTVSRTVAHKYIQTPFGTVPLRMFFTSKLQLHQGGSVSSKYVKYLIRELVRNESRQKPLSDQKIADVLNREHTIIISRRTVAKYREELNISSSSKRKAVQ